MNEELPTDMIGSLEKFFDTLILDFGATDDPNAHVRISSECRGLYEILALTSSDTVSAKRVKHKIGQMLKEIEEDQAINDEVKARIVQQLKGMTK